MRRHGAGRNRAGFDILVDQRELGLEYRGQLVAFRSPKLCRRLVIDGLGTTLTTTADISPTIGVLEYTNTTTGGHSWTIANSASNGPFTITMNNTGGATNPWGTSGAAIVTTSAGRINVYPNIVMTGDLYAGAYGLGSTGSQANMYIYGNIMSTSANPQTLYLRTSINGGSGYGTFESDGSIGTSGNTINILEDTSGSNTSCYVHLYGQLGADVGSVTMSASGGLMVISNSLDSSFTGPINIIAGSLQIGSGGGGETLGTTSIGDSGTLIFSHTDSFGYGGTISGTGSLTKSGTGNLTLSGNITYTGSTNISAGSLTINTGNGNITLSGPFVGTGAGGLTKTGATR